MLWLFLFVVVDAILLLIVATAFRDDEEIPRDFDVAMHEIAHKLRHH